MWLYYILKKLYYLQCNSCYAETTDPLGVGSANSFALVRLGAIYCEAVVAYCRRFDDLML